MLFWLIIRSSEQKSAIFLKLFSNKIKFLIWPSFQLHHAPKTVSLLMLTRKTTLILLGETHIKPKKTQLYFLLFIFFSDFQWFPAIFNFHEVKYGLPRVLHWTRLWTWSLRMLGQPITNTAEMCVADHRWRLDGAGGFWLGRIFCCILDVIIHENVHDGEHLLIFRQFCVYHIGDINFDSYYSCCTLSTLIVVWYVVCWWCWLGWFDVLMCYLWLRG